MSVDSALDPEPLHEIAQLAFAELLTPRISASVSFFADILGMEVVHSEGASVFLRAYEDPKDPSSNVGAMIDLLGFRLTEQVPGKDEEMKAAWLRVTNITHEVAFMIDAAGARGRLHHLAFWYGSPTYLMDVADICLDAGITVDAGPGKHGPGQAHYLYVWEPGGNRIELFGDVGYLIFDPSWKTVTWRDEDIGRRGHGSILTRESYSAGSPSVPDS